MDLFGTAGVRGDATDRVTPELALAVGRAAARHAGGRDATARDAGSGAGDRPTFVVGRDGRVTGDALVAAVSAGLQSGGADVVRVGQLPTPALAHASNAAGVDRGVMVTASHNPPADNGLKLFVDGVEYDRAAERGVEERVAAGAEPVAWDAWGASRERAVLADYRDAVVAFAAGRGGDPSGLRVAVDCGNGASSVATPQVLRALGADVRALNANVDGHFPGRPSKPTAETLGDLQAFLGESDCRLGLAHDGDGDRIVLLDGAGEIVHEDTIVAVLARHYVRESGAADPVVVTTPNASARVDQAVETAGGRVERVRLGALHEGVAEVQRAGGTVVFAAEPWKHLHTAFGGWIDGVVSAALLTVLVGDAGGVDALRDGIEERPYEKANVSCPDDRKAAAMERVEDRAGTRFPDATVDTSYGVRVAFPNGDWTLIRPSGTEPYLRIYAESERVDDLLANVRGLVTEAVGDS